MEAVAWRYTADVDGVPIDFAVGRFEADGRTQHVFYCHWDAWLGRARVEPEMKDIARWRLDRARAGRRRSDAAYVALVVPASSREAATAWMDAWLPRLLRKD